MARYLCRIFVVASVTIMILVFAADAVPEPQQVPPVRAAIVVPPVESNFSPQYILPQNKSPVTTNIKLQEDSCVGTTTSDEWSSKKYTLQEAHVHHLQQFPCFDKKNHVGVPPFFILPQQFVFQPVECLLIDVNTTTTKRGDNNWIDCKLEGRGTVEVALVPVRTKDKVSAVLRNSKFFNTIEKLYQTVLATEDVNSNAIMDGKEDEELYQCANFYLQTSVGKNNNKRLGDANHRSCNCQNAIVSVAIGSYTLSKIRELLHSFLKVAHRCTHFVLLVSNVQFVMEVRTFLEQYQSSHVAIMDSRIVLVDVTDIMINIQATLKKSIIRNDDAATLLTPKTQRRHIKQKKRAAIGHTLRLLLLDWLTSEKKEDSTVISTTISTEEAVHGRRTSIVNDTDFNFSRYTFLLQVDSRDVIFRVLDPFHHLFNHILLLPNVQNQRDELQQPLEDIRTANVLQYADDNLSNRRERKVVVSGLRSVGVVAELDSVAQPILSTWMRQIDGIESANFVQRIRLVVQQKGPSSMLKVGQGNQRRANHSDDDDKKGNNRMKDDDAKKKSMIRSVSPLPILNSGLYFGPRRRVASFIQLLSHAASFKLHGTMDQGFLNLLMYFMIPSLSLKNHPEGDDHTKKTKNNNQRAIVSTSVVVGEEKKSFEKKPKFGFEIAVWDPLHGPFRHELSSIERHSCDIKSETNGGGRMYQQYSLLHQLDRCPVNYCRVVLRDVFDGDVGKTESEAKICAKGYRPPPNFSLKRYYEC